MAHTQLIFYKVFVISNVFLNYYYESDLNMFRMTVILNIFSKRTRCIIRDCNISSFY